MRIFNKKNKDKDFILQSKGFCPVCDKSVVFRAENEWLRDWFLCTNCGSIPRERALIHAIQIYFENYGEMTIHESSPSIRGASLKLKKNVKNYSSSYYYPDVKPGEFHLESNEQCQNLEMLTFEDESFDLFVTQDVMEHIFDPEKAFSEIARVLKPGGAHIFTVPIINKAAKSERWASRNNKGEIVNHHEAEFHGDPINDDGVLVTMHWGYDIADFIYKSSGIPTTIVMIDDLSFGIRAEYIEVLVSRKY